MSSVKQNSAPRYAAERTTTLTTWAAAVLETSAPFLRAQELVTRLGVWTEGGLTEFGFWVPEVSELSLDEKDVRLELFTPLETVDLGAAESEVRFRYQQLPVRLTGDYAWCAAEGVKVGNRETLGALYQLKFTLDGERRTVRDHLAHSLPFGVFSPAEVYDLRGLLSDRKDTTHFANLTTTPDPDGTPRVTPPSNILQVHVRSATQEGSLRALSEQFRALGEALEKGAGLSSAQELLNAYDAVQLLPIEPVIEYEGQPPFFQHGELPEEGGEMSVSLHKPDMTNWGYDIVISGSAAVNPALLATGRPDEFLDFIETLHALPKPVKLILDIVYGHADNQAVDVLNRPFIAGPGMYGQSINFREPTVRALMLELQRRKSLYGVDGIRVDGAQDFKYWDAEIEELLYDDAYLKLMNDITLDVAGTRYRPYMIFEDGRPWPRDDWELASTYREVTQQLPNVHQWGPLTFAHNTPFLFTFWLAKWWRIREILEVGSHWITGCANHDTLRRGTQVPLDARINTFLGDGLPEILRNAYDNPAAKLFDYGIMPGVPMDFLNAAARAPWSFIRNTDERYGVKVMSEESRFLHWAVDTASFDHPKAFERLKAAGFSSLEQLRTFLKQLDHVMQATDYDLEQTSALLRTTGLYADLELSVPGLKNLARAWMDDLHDYVKVPRYLDKLEPERVQFMRRVREFRLRRDWLMNDLKSEDVFGYRHPTLGSVVFYGHRKGPDGEQVLFAANMEGEPCEVTPSLLVPLPPDGWKLALATPGLKADSPNQTLILSDSQGVVFVREGGRE